MVINQKSTQGQNLGNMYGEHGASAPLLPTGGTRAARAPAESDKDAEGGGICGRKRPAAAAEDPCLQIVEVPNHQEGEVPSPSIPTRPAAHAAAPGGSRGAG